MSLSALRGFQSKVWGRASENGVPAAFDAFKRYAADSIESGKALCKNKMGEYTDGQTPKLQEFRAVYMAGKVWGRASENGVPAAFDWLQKLTMTAIAEATKSCVSEFKSPVDLSSLRHSEFSIWGRMTANGVPDAFYRMKNAVADALDEWSVEVRERMVAGKYLHRMKHGDLDTPSELKEAIMRSLRHQAGLDTSPPKGDGQGNYDMFGKSENKVSHDYTSMHAEAEF